MSYFSFHFQFPIPFFSPHFHVLPTTTVSLNVSIILLLTLDCRLIQTNQTLNLREQCEFPPSFPFVILVFRFPISFSFLIFSFRFPHFHILPTTTVSLNVSIILWCQLVLMENFTKTKTVKSSTALATLVSHEQNNFFIAFRSKVVTSFTTEAQGCWV